MFIVYTRKRINRIERDTSDSTIFTKLEKENQSYRCRNQDTPIVEHISDVFGRATVKDGNSSRREISSFINRSILEIESRSVSLFGDSLDGSVRQPYESPGIKAKLTHLNSTDINLSPAQPTNSTSERSDSTNLTINPKSLMQKLATHKFLTPVCRKPKFRAMKPLKPKHFEYNPHKFFDQYSRTRTKNKKSNSIKMDTKSRDLMSKGLSHRNFDMSSQLEKPKCHQTLKNNLSTKSLYVDMKIGNSDTRNGFRKVGSLVQNYAKYMNTTIASPLVKSNSVKKKKSIRALYSSVGSIKRANNNKVSLTSHDCRSSVTKEESVA